MKIKQIYILFTGFGLLIFLGLISWKEFLELSDDTISETSKENK